MTFGQRLKKHRKLKNLTQTELAEAIGVSPQAVSKWETDIGMPDISQIVPLSRELDISSDILLGIVDDETDREFEKIYAECMEAENLMAYHWPPDVKKIVSFFQKMYSYFSAHPNHPRAAEYLLDQAETYWGNNLFFENEAIAVKECERFANCIFRHGNDADLQAKARFLIASIWAHTGKTEQAYEMLGKMPFLYGDRCYWSAEVAMIAEDYEKAEMFCRKSFTHKARFISRCIRLTANIKEKIEYEEYMLRIIEAFLSGGDYIPHRQMYQKLSLLSGLIKQHLQSGNFSRAEEHFHSLLEAGEKYLSFLKNGEKGKSFLLFDDSDTLEKNRSIEQKRHLVTESLRRTIYICEQNKNAKNKKEIADCICKAKEICNFFHS